MIELRLAADVLARIRESETETSYHELGYLFVLETIEYLQGRLPIRRHVSGPELANACRDNALEQFGLMARHVLAHWGIQRTEDIGRIVFTLVGIGLLVAQPGDRPEDFKGVFEFDEAFNEAYTWPGLRPDHRAERADAVGEGT